MTTNEYPVQRAVFLTQRLLPLLQDGGRILNVSSGLARFALPGCGLRRDEGAMEVLTRYQAKELGGRGISVNIIAPGAIETDFGGGRCAITPKGESAYRRPDYTGARWAAG